MSTEASKDSERLEQVASRNDNDTDTSAAQEKAPVAGEGMDAGQIEAWYREVVRENEKRIYHFAFKCLGNREDALDVKQAVSLKLWAGREKYARDPSRILHWMLRVAKREVITILRARARQAKANRGRDPDERPGPKGVGQAPANPLVALMTNERTEAVDAALERLDDESREVLVLHTTGGLDYGEIADLLGITERMAKRRFANAIRQVRHDLGVSGTQD